MVLGMRREGLGSEYTVTSSSSYSSSSEVKAGNSEVQRVPGNDFSLCTAPTFSRIQGISNGGQNGDMYRNNSKYKSEDKRNGGLEFVWFGGAQNGRNRIMVAEELSRTRRIRVGFDIQNAETYMTLGTYILDGNESGMHKERRQYSEGT